jgi:hypothetical protein
MGTVNNIHQLQHHDRQMWILKHRPTGSLFVVEYGVINDKFTCLSQGFVRGNVISLEQYKYVRQRSMMLAGLPCEISQPHPPVIPAVRCSKLIFRPWMYLIIAFGAMINLLLTAYKGYWPGIIIFALFFFACLWMWHGARKFYLS